MSERRGAPAHALIRAVVTRPVTTTMITVAIILFGIVAVMRMPVDLLPDLSYPSITVRTDYPDASPAEVEELVTRPVEELVGAVPGVIAVESASREGTSEVVLDFMWGTPVDVAMADVREKLDRLRLPPSADRPIVLRYDPSQEPVLRLALTKTEDGDHSLAAMRDVADRTVKRQLEKLPGVAAVQLHGGDEEEIRVEIDPDRLAALRVDAQEVVDAITRDNINRPGGGLTENENRYLIRTVHEARTPEALARLIVRDTSGAQLRIRDVARVARVAVERQELALVSGGDAVELSVFREGDANTVSVAHAVLDHLEGAELPAGLRLVRLSNQSSFIEAAIVEVASNTVLGGALAVLVLMFFLRRLRSTAVIAIAIPISLLAAFVPLRTLGVSLNVMSLGGLALGVGMLVDNSIVALEAIARVREKNPEWSRREAAVTGTSEIAASVVASTLTTVAVFLPMAFVEGVAGQLVRDLSLAVSLSITASMVVSLTLVPVLEGLAVGPVASGETPRTILTWPIVPFALIFRLLRIIVAALGRLAAIVAAPLVRAYEALERVYPATLAGALRVRILVLLAAIGLCGAAVLASQGLARTLIPELRQGEFHIQIALPQGTSLERTTSIARAVMSVAEADPGVELAFARVGSVARAASASGALLGTHLAQVDVRLDDEAYAMDPAIEERIFSRVRETIADPAIVLVMGRPELFSFEAPLEVRVFAEELPVAIAHAKILVPLMQHVDGLEDVTPDDLSGRPEVRVQFDRQRLGRLSLDIDTAAASVQRAIAGEVAGVMHAPDKQLDIRVQLPRVDRSRQEDVDRIHVGLAGDVPVVLSSVADIETELGPAEIRRIDGRRGLRIRARFEGSDLGGVAEALRAELEDIAAPNVDVELAGQVREMGGSLTSLAFTALLSLFLVYVVMASSFESLHHPFLIMATVPLAFAGVVFACLIADVPISAMVGIGAIILGGIVVNNAIVLVNAVNQRRGQGLEVEAALIDAGRVRLRPIVMTTATTVLGLLPMALGLGEGAALRQPLAVAVIGGLVLSTVLTLVVIPCAYALLPGRTRDAWKT